jgi:hypothetical protein
MDDLTRYLLVRDSSGAILAELDSTESALRMLKLLGEEELPLRDLSLVRLNDHAGELVGTTSWVTVRPAGLGSQHRRRS